MLLLRSGRWLRCIGACLTNSQPEGEPLGELVGEPEGDSARVQPESSPSVSHKRPACERRGLSLSERNGRKPGRHT